MLKRTSDAGVLLVGLFLARADVPAAQSAQDGSRAAKSDRLTLDLYLDMETVSEPQLSPDGSQIVYTRGWIDKVNDKRESALWIMNVDGSRNRFLAKGSGARWSPSGDRIAFTTQGEPKGTQIFVRWMDAEGATSQITRVDQAPSAVAWSPDGKQLSFSMLVEERNTWPIKMPKAPAGAKWTEAPRIVEQLNYRRDRNRLHRQRLPSRVRRAGIRRDAAADHVRQLRSHRHGLDAGRPKHPLQRPAQRERHLPVARVGNLRRRRGRRRHPSAHEAQGPRQQSDGFARRQADRLHRLRLDDRYLGGQQDLPDEQRRLEPAPHLR